MLSRCFLDFFFVGVGAFVIGRSQIFSFSAFGACTMYVGFQEENEVCEAHMNLSLPSNFALTRVQVRLTSS